MTTEKTDAAPRCTEQQLVGDPFRVLSLEAIREVRNEALNHHDGDTFAMHGYTFVMPGALLRSNTRLMLADEKFAIALCAGCEVETSGAMDDGRLTYRTRNPVGFAIVNGRVQVFERRDDVLCERIER